MLIKKVDGLMKAIEVESKKVKKEAAVREKELISTTVDDKKTHKNTNFSKRYVKFIGSIRTTMGLRYPSRRLPTFYLGSKSFHHLPFQTFTSSSRWGF